MSAGPALVWEGSLWLCIVLRAVCLVSWHSRVLQIKEPVCLRFPRLPWLTGPHNVHSTHSLVSL